MPRFDLYNEAKKKKMNVSFYLSCIDKIIIDM